MIKKEMNKLGQFYLIAAIIIVAAIIGFAAISNYAKKKSSVKLYDLGDELGIESGEVLEYGVMKGDEVDDAELMEHFTTLFDTYAGENKEIYYIFGNREEIIAYSYGEETGGTIDLIIGGKSSGLNILERVRQDLDESSFTRFDNKIIATINEIEYEFELKPGQNFYFVISQEIEEEEHIVTS